MSRVYFIRPVGMDGPIKIGCSDAPVYRLAALATGSPTPLEIAASIPGGFILERRLHATFAASRTHGEWFSWSPALQSVINAIGAGSFDMDAHCPIVGGRAATLISTLGGLSAVASATRNPVSTVQGWKEANFIPRWHQPTLLDLAKALGKRVGTDDFPPQSARISRKDRIKARDEGAAA